MSEDRDGRGGAVRVREHLWIPMPDGVRLAARLWLPATAPHAPVPALFEYIPYRKADMVRVYDRDGQRVRTIGARGRGPGQLRFPSSVAIASRRAGGGEAGELYVADQGNRRVQVFENDDERAGGRGRVRRPLGDRRDGPERPPPDALHPHRRRRAPVGRWPTAR